MTLEGFRQKFRTCVPESEEFAPQFAVRIENYLVRWTELANVAKTFDGLKDLLLWEQFINASPENLALFLKERKPGNITAVAELAELNLQAHGSLDMCYQKLTINQGKKHLYHTKQVISGKPIGGSTIGAQEKGKINRVCYFYKKQRTCDQGMF